MGTENDRIKIDLVEKRKKLENERSELREEERTFNARVEEDEERVRLQKKELEELYDSTDDPDIKLIIEQKIERMEYSHQKRRSLIEDVFADIASKLKKNEKKRDAVEEDLKNL